MVYSVHISETFEKEVLELGKDKQERIGKLYFHLKDNPYVGDQLKFKFFREKRLDEKRIYYLVYDDLKVVLMVAVSGKKDQQETINYIINHLNEFKEYAEKLADN